MLGRSDPDAETKSCAFTRDETHRLRLIARKRATLGGRRLIARKRATRASSSWQRLTGARPVPGKPCTARESNRNCVAARRGGEQRKESMQTITRVNRTRPSCGPSLRVNERRQARLERDTWSAHPTVKHGHGRMEVIEDGMQAKVLSMKMRELAGKAGQGSTNHRSDRLTKAYQTGTGPRPPEVRVPIVAQKSGNADGAKGGRKMNGGHP